MQGYTHFFPIAYAATDVTAYQQDVVIHRSEGTSYEETVGDLKVWHVYVGNRCKSDYGDVRFTDASGTALDYYLWPDYDAESARFCVRLAGATSAGELLVWYGNPSATTTSDGDATFPHFDQFDGTSLDLTKWTLAPRAIATVANGQLSLKGTYGSGLDGICGKTTFDTSKYQVQWGVVSGQPTTAYVHWGWANSAVAESMTDGIAFRWASSYGKQVGLKRAGVWNPVGYDWPSTPGEYRVARSGSTALFMSSAGVHSINDAAKVTTVDLAPYAALSESGTSAIVLDYCVVRAYSATPPAATAFGPEQVRGTLHHVVFGSANMMVI